MKKLIDELMYGTNKEFNKFVIEQAKVSKYSKRVKKKKLKFSSEM